MPTANTEGRVGSIWKVPPRGRRRRDLFSDATPPIRPSPSAFAVGVPRKVVKNRSPHSSRAASQKLRPSAPREQRPHRPRPPAPRRRPPQIPWSLYSDGLYSHGLRRRPPESTFVALCSASLCASGPPSVCAKAVHLLFNASEHADGECRGPCVDLKGT